MDTFHEFQGQAGPAMLYEFLQIQRRIDIVRKTRRLEGKSIDPHCAGGPAIAGKTLRAKTRSDQVAGREKKTIGSQLVP